MRAFELTQIRFRRAGQDVEQRALREVGRLLRQIEADGCHAIGRGVEIGPDRDIDGNVRRERSLESTPAGIDRVEQPLVRAYGLRTLAAPAAAFSVGVGIR